MALDLAALGFRAETVPGEPAVALVWDLPDPTAAVDDPALRIQRLLRRYPGRGRRGIVDTAASAADLADGDVVFTAGALQWDIEERRDEVVPDGLISTVRQYAYTGTPPDRVLVRSVRREFAAGVADPSRTTVRVFDRAGISPGAIHYYTAFAGPQLLFSRRTQASALATDAAGPDLFGLLPTLDRRHDTALPEPAKVAAAERGRGQLERFLRAVQAHADMLLGEVDALRDLHDVRRADARLLAPLAQMLGWKLKVALDEDGQRTEIGFATEAYRRTGTAPLVAAMVNRLTGWPAEVREFPRNVLRSWDETRVERTPAGARYLDGGARPRPAGSIDTGDRLSLLMLHEQRVDDTNAYSYDCGARESDGSYARTETTWFNRETIGVYASPPPRLRPAEVASAWSRVRLILQDFLPAQVRAVLVVQPGILQERFDTLAQVAEGVK